MSLSSLVPPFALVLLLAVAPCEFPTPPEQPDTGPGGSDYPHAGLTASVHGEGTAQYWLFEPTDPTPETAPLVVLLHGWSFMDPAAYDAWIEHLARRGNLIVYPRYQADLLTPSEQFLANTIGAVLDAIEQLDGEDHIAADLGRFAVVGHSVGGLLAANLAAIAEDASLPVPKAVMCIEPGGAERRSGWHDLIEDMSRIPPGTLLLTVVGDDDRLVGEAGAKLIYDGATQVPPDDKDFVTLASDRHGWPPLIANHLAPLSNESVDALDFFALWKLFDGLTDAAFYGTHRQYALGDTPEQRFMGLWSDGVPVSELRVTDSP